MPLSAGRDLNSSIEAYGQRRMFWPLTFISNTMLPTDGTIETTVCVFASCSCTTSPFCRTEYGCADAGIANASTQAMADAVVAFLVADVCDSDPIRQCASLRDACRTASLPAPPFLCASLPQASRFLFL